MHIPVLLQEVISFLDPRPGEFFIDGTVNGGGHARAILARIKKGTFLGCEWDKDILNNLQATHLQEDFAAKIVLKNANYADIARILKKEKLPKADGLLLDLGFSSSQLENGFGLSFSASHSREPLDMRYEKSPTRKTAAEIVNTLPPAKLTAIFRDLGEERYARKIAEYIVAARKRRKIITVGDLVEVIKEAVGEGYEHGRIHPATRVFQALRIHVNDELTNLQLLLSDLPKILKPGGRAAIISFHSLEDRIVKISFRAMKEQKLLILLTKKPITSGYKEIINNPRARSAKLRVARLN